jgi:hypothetical protein
VGEIDGVVGGAGVFVDAELPGVPAEQPEPPVALLGFPKTLTDVEPNRGETTSGRRTSNYSWSGGFLRIRGRDTGESVSPVAEPANRGDRALVLADASGLEAGDEIRLTMKDDEEQTLAHYLYAGEPGPIDNLPGQIRPSQGFRVVGIKGNRVELDRPLRFRVREGWSPRVRTFEPTVTHTGIEGMTLTFPPGRDYEGHFTELGHNGITIDGDVAHAWVRDVHIQNAESGIFLRGRFSTLRGISMESSRTPSDRDHVGHHAITLSGEDNLLTDFSIGARYIHDVTVSRGSFGNVAANGRGIDLSLDHHRRAPCEDLFTNLHAGRGTRLWSSGGGADLGRHAAARNTYWNIRADQTIPPPPDRFAPAMINVVGVANEVEPVLEQEGRWIEPIAPNRLRPKNLYEAQRQRRLNAGD